MNVDLNFEEVKCVLDKNESIFDSRISFPTLVVAVSDIFKKFPNEENVDYQIRVITKFLNENPNDIKTRGSIFNALSHSSILDKNIQNPTIKSLFEDFYVDINNQLDERIKAYEQIPATERTQNANLILQNYKNRKKTLNAITQSEKQLNLSVTSGFLPENINLLPHTKLNSLISDIDTIKLFQADFLRHAISLNGINDTLEADINKFMSVLKSFANYNVKPNALGVGLGCLTGDIANAYYRFNSKLDNGIHLWDIVTRYNIKEIKSLDSDGKRNVCPKEIKEKFPNANEMLYVYTQDGELFFSPTVQNGKHIQHIMVANGKPVLMAGMAYIQDNKLVAIDNSSGHYRPTIDRMKYLFKELLSENKDVLVFDHTNGTQHNLLDFSKKMVQFNLNKIRESLDVESNIELKNNSLTM